MAQKRVRLLITGRVQGVFFRQSTKARAIRDSVRGWVRNLDDGRVEAVLEGDAGAVDAVTEWCRRGPANSIVHGVDVQEEAHTGEFGEFDVRY